MALHALSIKIQGNSYFSPYGDTDVPIGII
jgi:hypothetical protein